MTELIKKPEILSEEEVDGLDGLDMLEAQNTTTFRVTSKLWWEALSRHMIDDEQSGGKILLPQDVKRFQEFAEKL